MADIIGTPGADTINGTAEDDSIEGLGGNDILRGLNGDDYLYGGDGRDVLEGGAGYDVLIGGAGNDRLVSGDGGGILSGGTGADRMIGGAGGDEYDVDNEGDVVVEAANGGFDVVWSSIDYTLAQNSNIEGLGSDTEANVTLTGNSLDNTMWSYGGGRGGSDILRGGGGNDKIYVIEGDRGTVLSGGGGNDLMSVEFNLGALTMRGGTGNDTYEMYYGSSSRIIENANEGIDTIRTTHDHTLQANVENLYIDPENLDEEPSDFSRTGTGNSLDNFIFVNGGTNTLYGLGGNDTLVSDADVATTMYGGGGRDQFHVDIDQVGFMPQTSLMDFRHDFDTIVLYSDQALTLPDGNLAAASFHSGSGATAVAQTAAHRIIYDMSTGNLYYDSDGNGAVAQLLFGNLGGTSQDPDHTDFVVA